MTNNKVAVEMSLNGVKDALQKMGYDVVPMDNMASCCCCVVSGQDKNMMGNAETHTKVPVINAQGLSTQEIVEQVKRCTC